MNKKDKKALEWMKKYLRYTDYIGAAQLYLKENFLLSEKLNPDHIKSRILGHWGTVPGLNFIYAQLNYLIMKHRCEMLLITGPGHGAPSTLANLFAEGTLQHFYPDYTQDRKGAGKLIHDFSWPHTKFPSHITPTVPGSILEGGELGYSLATAFGAAFDNPDLIVAAVIGDGESETGTIAASWHSNKFLNPKTSGAVLPIVHVNSYKISNPTLFGTMSDKEVKSYFSGLGYRPFIVDGENLDRNMMDTLEKAYQIIRAVQKKARRGRKRADAQFCKKKNQNKTPLKPQWPVIILRSIKGWKGVKSSKGHPVEGSFHSHGTPLSKAKTDPIEFDALEKWLKSYKIEELIDKSGKPKKEVLAYVPQGNLRIGMSRHAIGGTLCHDLNFPKLSSYEVKIESPGSMKASSMEVGGKLLRDVIESNPKNFRILCPDEIVSNKLQSLFEVTGRAYMWPVAKNAEHMDPDGRVMEILSENVLQGWYQGYLLTGRHGIFVSYEAFATIINSMVDQHAKFLKQSFQVSWRKPVPSAIYLLTSVGWRQDHNGYSHQNPSFVSNVLQKHGEFCQIYYPADANSTLAAFEETMTRKNAICVVVAGKTDLPQWQTLKEAREQAKSGMAIWEWVGGERSSKDPDVVLISAGDYITREAILGVQICKELAPELKMRYVNISELTALSLGDRCRHKPQCTPGKHFEYYCTKDKPIVFSYHGYTNDIEQILWSVADPKRFSIHGYSEVGSTTTPFDMTISNKVSCYHIAMDLIEQGAKENKVVAQKKKKLIHEIEKRIEYHQNYIRNHGDDPPEMASMQWTA